MNQLKNFGGSRSAIHLGHSKKGHTTLMLMQYQRRGYPLCRAVRASLSLPCASNFPRCFVHIHHPSLLLHESVYAFTHRQRNFQSSKTTSGRTLA